MLAIVLQFTTAAIISLAGMNSTLPQQDGQDDAPAPMRDRMTRPDDNARQDGNRPGPDQRRGIDGMPDRDRDRDRDRGERPLRMTPELRASLISVVTDLRPLNDADRKRLEDMTDDDLAAIATGRMRHLLTLAQLRESDPELYQLKLSDLKLGQRAFSIARKMGMARAGGNADRVQALADELRTVVAEQVDVSLRVKAHEIAAYEARLEVMKGQLERDLSGRGALIARRFEALQRRSESAPAQGGRGSRGRGDDDRTGDRPDRGPDRPDRGPDRN
ncbi:MAG: hypothetical protein ACR2GY_12055 [Phycisphaerales bacterium]